MTCNECKRERATRQTMLALAEKLRGQRASKDPDSGTNGQRLAGEGGASSATAPALPGKE